MLSRASSAAIVLLLAWSVAWGQCAYCPLMLNPSAAQPEQSHGCCPKPSDCHTPSPEETKDCPGDKPAPDTVYKAPVQLVELVAAPLAGSAGILVPALARTAHVAVDAAAAHSPPDLYLLNSVLLI